jgi:GNAT superfamily N-acetyltransferase
VSGLTSERLLPEAEARLRCAALTADDIDHIMGTKPADRPAIEDLVVADVFQFRALVAMTRAVIHARPAYAPRVVDGETTVQEWLWAKEPTWRRALLTPDGDMAAHVGVKSDRTGPDLEMVRLMVHPDWQRRGLAARMVDLAVAEFGTRLHAKVGPGSPSHHLLLGLGWVATGTAMEPGEPNPCVVLTCPHARRKAAR